MKPLSANSTASVTWAVSLVRVIGHPQRFYKKLSPTVGYNGTIGIYLMMYKYQLVYSGLNGENEKRKASGATS